MNPFAASCNKIAARASIRDAGTGSLAIAAGLTGSAPVSACGAERASCSAPLARVPSSWTVYAALVSLVRRLARGTRSASAPVKTDNAARRAALTAQRASAAAVLACSTLCARGGLAFTQKTLPRLAVLASAAERTLRV